MHAQLDILEQAALKRFPELAQTDSTSTSGDLRVSPPAPTFPAGGGVTK